MARSVLVVGEDELVVGHLCTGEHRFLLGNELGAAGGRQGLGVIGDDFALRGILVGGDVDLAVIDTDDAALILHAADELHVVRVAVLEVLDVDLVPVTAAAGDDIGQVAAVVGEVQLLQGHGAVLAQRVGVEHHLVCAVGTVLVEDALVLQAVVLEEIEFVLHLEGSTHLLVVGEFGDALLHVLAERDF